MDINTNPRSQSDEIHLNTRSIRNKTEYLSNLVESFHIACFSETHLDREIDSRYLKLDSFDEPIRNDRIINVGGIMVIYPAFKV